MNNEQRTNNAFTLIELVVAVALLAMVLSFSGVVFKVSIDAYRTAGANTEIMQKLRAITDQLNRDFKGLRTDAPLLIWFERDNNTGFRYDQILFFANGDFQSTQLYSGTPFAVPALTGDPVVGNVARIYYGQADIFDYASGAVKPYWDANSLARRRHILTADPDIYYFPDIMNFVSSFISGNNNLYEHDSISLARWKAISNYPLYNDQVIDTCFNNRPEIDFQSITGLHMLMSQGVSSFAIQWAYPDLLTGEYQWWPSVDPDGDGDYSDSDFITTGNEFGNYFNMPSVGVSGWSAPGTSISNVKALKFTFTLYDSKGILEEGRTFTHIVYLGE